MGWIILWTVLAGLGLAGVLWLADQAKAETPTLCGPRGNLSEKLAEQGYVLMGAGVDKDGDLMEMYVKPDGLWAVFYTNRQQMTCTLDFGAGFEPAPEKPDGAA